SGRPMGYAKSRWLGVLGRKNTPTKMTAGRSSLWIGPRRRHDSSRRDVTRSVRLAADAHAEAVRRQQAQGVEAGGQRRALQHDRLVLQSRVVRDRQWLDEVAGDRVRRLGED